MAERQQARRSKRLGLHSQSASGEIKPDEIRRREQTSLMEHCACCNSLDRYSWLPGSQARLAWSAADYARPDSRNTERTCWAVGAAARGLSRGTERSLLLAQWTDHTLGLDDSQNFGAPWGGLDETQHTFVSRRHSASMLSHPNARSPMELPTVGNRVSSVSRMSLHADTSATSGGGVFARLSVQPGLEPPPNFTGSGQYTGLGSRMTALHQVVTGK